MKIGLVHLAASRLKPSELGLLDRFDLQRTHLENRLFSSSRDRGNILRVMVWCKQQRGVFITRRRAGRRVLIRFIVALVVSLMVLRPVMLLGRPRASVRGLPARGIVSTSRRAVVVWGMSTRSMHHGC